MYHPGNKYVRTCKDDDPGDCIKVFTLERLYGINLQSLCTPNPTSHPLSAMPPCGACASRVAAGQLDVNSLSSSSTSSSSTTITDVATNCWVPYYRNASGHCKALDPANAGWFRMRTGDYDYDFMPIFEMGPAEEEVPIIFP